MKRIEEVLFKVLETQLGADNNLTFSEDYIHSIYSLLMVMGDEDVSISAIHHRTDAEYTVNVDYSRVNISPYEAKEIFDMLQDAYTDQEGAKQDRENRKIIEKLSKFI